MKKEIYGLLLLLSSTTFAAEFSLEDALKQAEEYNNTIKEKKLESENASLDLENAEIDKLPTFDVSSNLSEGEDSDSFSHTFSIEQTLYNGGSIKNTIEKNELEKEKSALELLNEIEDVKLEVITYYMNALKYQNQLEIYKGTLEELEAQYAEQSLLYENKLIAKSDILELEAEIIETESSIIEITNNYKVELEELKNSIQYKSDAELTLTMPEVDIASISYQEDLHKLSENSIDIKIEKLESEISAEDIEIQKADYLPEVDFTFSYGSSDDELVDSFGDWEWEAEVSISYEIFDWGKTKNYVNQTKNTYEIQMINQQEVEQQAELDLKTKYFELEKYEKQLEAQKKLVEAREEKYKIDKVKYENKYIDTETYISSRNDVTESKLELVNLETEYYIAYNDYLNILN